MIEATFDTTSFDTRCLKQTKDLLGDFLTATVWELLLVIVFWEAIEAVVRQITFSHILTSALHIQKYHNPARRHLLIDQICLLTSIHFNHIAASLPMSGEHHDSFWFDLLRDLAADLLQL